MFLGFYQTSDVLKLRWNVNPHAFVFGPFSGSAYKADASAHASKQLKPIATFSAPHHDLQLGFPTLVASVCVCVRICS